MRNSRLARTLLVVSSSLWLAAGCSGGSDSTYQLDDLCGANDGAFVVFVDKVVECAPELTFFLGELPSPQDISEACTAQFDGFAEDGTIILGEQAGLDACLAAIAGADCLTFDIDNLEECDDLVEGTLEIDSACETNDQCAGDAFCDQPDEASCGACVATLADGESCNENSECTSGKCRSNGACGPFGQEGDNCDDNEDCVGQLECDTTCQVPGDANVGDTCSEFAQCGFPFSDLFCNEQEGQCEEFLALGADCFDGKAALGVCDLLASETCDFMDTGKCQAPTIVGEGEACAFQDGRKCEDGLVCSGGDNGVCRAQGLGATCDSNREGNTCGLFLECQADDTCGYENDYTGMCPAP